MLKPFLPASDRRKAVAIYPVSKDGLKRRLEELPDLARSWVGANRFAAAQGEIIAIPDADGRLDRVLFGLGASGDPADPFATAKLSSSLPHGRYYFADLPASPIHAALGWALGTYHFGRYVAGGQNDAQLRLPAQVDADLVSRLAEGVFLARDLINTPANDLGPEELEAAVRAVGKRHKAKVTAIEGDALLKQNFPLIHAVGRASSRAPRLVDLVWGAAKHPKVTLVGKGVCFDTGGLDLKGASNMLLMKKDMGGAANVLALAQMIMDAQLPVRLRLLIPAVENSVSGTAFRPGDIFRARNGLSVEIGNTDAEGRLVLADALALADEEAPDILIDMATLTGAARVALGPELPPFYTDDENMAVAIARHASQEADPLWRMPLWTPYEKMLESKIADLNNVSGGGFAGSVTAALFLRRFVSKARSWTHFDIYGWNPSSRAGRPEGGEAQGIRALYALLQERYAR